LSPPPGAQFISVLLGNPEDYYLLTSSDGYGFVCRYEDMISRNKAGKHMLNLGNNAEPLPPVAVTDNVNNRLVAITTQGYLLTFPIKDLPQLSKGKGNKIIGIPRMRLITHEEYLSSIACVPQDHNLILYCGKRHITLKPADLEDFAGERGRRGRKLSRGFQKVDRVEIEAPNTDVPPISE
jgi:topoisomerase-4 subunit A